MWALGVILTNLACGRNPWKRASVEDPTFRAYLKDPHFLSTILPISEELEAILRRIFDRNPRTRITLPELRRLVLRCPHFMAPPCRPVAPPTPPQSEYDSVPPSLPEVVDSTPCSLPPSPPHTPPAHASFQPPAPRDSEKSAQEEPASRFYLTPAASESPRIPASPGNGPVSQCAPLIGTNLFDYVPSTGSWIQPSGFGGHHHLPSLVTA